MLSAIIPLLVNSLGWSIKPVLEKMAVQKIGIIDFLFIRYIFTGFLSLGGLVFYIYWQNKTISNYISFNYSISAIKWGLIVSSVAIVALLAHYYLLKNFKVHYVVGMVESSIVLFSTLLSSLILKEKLSANKCWGILLISLGIYFINAV